MFFAQQRVGGKQKIVFVTDNEEGLITEEELSKDISGRKLSDAISINSMFDFKYKEDIEFAYSLLKIEQKAVDGQEQYDIQMRDHDELIDLQPCISLYQMVSYFHKYDIDKEISQYFEIHEGAKIKKENVHDLSLDEKILYLTSLETKHNRYRTQVTLPLVDVRDRAKLHDRLGTLLGQDEDVQVDSLIPFYDEAGVLQFEAIGLADVMRDQTIFEIRYMEEFSHEHFLVCASYMIAQNAEAAYLWNIKNNTIYSVSIPNRQAFLDAVTIAVTKGDMKKYYGKKQQA
jgi:hypothetical protein